MKKLIFFIFIFLLNYGVVLNVETCHGMSLQHIYKNLAAQSMFQAEHVFSVIEKLENDIRQAKSITDQFEREKALFGEFLKVNEFDTEKLDPISKKRFFCLVLNLLSDLGLYMTSASLFYDRKNALGLDRENLPIEVVQRNQKLSTQPKLYIDQTQQRFDFLFSRIDRPDFNVDLRIFIWQCFAKEWAYLAGDLEYRQKTELVALCDFNVDTLYVFMLSDALIKGDLDLLKKILEKILENNEIPLFAKGMLAALPSIFKDHGFNFKEMRNKIFTDFTFTLQQREEGFEYLKNIFGCLPQENKLRIDFFKFEGALIKDWRDAYPYEYIYRNILFFSEKGLSVSSEIMDFSANDLEVSLPMVTDQKDEIFLVFLLIAIKSKDISKYKIALKILIGQERSVNYSDMYMNLFVATWNTYKEQQGFVINPMTEEIDASCVRLIQEFYTQDMQKIIEFWQGFDKAKFESSTLVTDFLPSEGKKVNIIGDIHGEINGIIFPLVSRGLIRLTGNVILWDLKIRQQVTRMSTTCVFLPEVQILPGKEDEIWQFLGDLIDRGKFTDECIAFLDYLFKKEPRLLNNIHIVFGNHEFNLLTNGGSVIPSYSGRNFLLVKEIIRSWINEDFLQYSFVANGWLYTHSFVSINFLIKFYKELDEFRGVIDPDLIDRAKIAINWFLNDKAEEGLPEQIDVASYERLNFDFNSEEYKENIRILNDILTLVFICHIRFAVDEVIQTKSNSCIFDLEISPLWARQSDSVVPCPNIKNGFGHSVVVNDSSGGSCLAVKSRVKGNVLYRHLVDYDCALSYGIWSFFNVACEGIPSQCKYNLGSNCLQLKFNPVYFSSGFMKGFAEQFSALQILEKIQSAQEELASRA